MTAHGPVFYDCEASGLDGVPIEIGWAYAEANGTLVSEAHLIKPATNWNISLVWDRRAEALHKISQAELVTSGAWPFRIARRMNEALAGRELFADSAYDEHWLRQLFEAGGEDPAFIVRRTCADVLITQRAATLRYDEKTFERIKKEAAQLAPRRHRSEADARHLAQLWLMLGQRPV